MPRTQLVNIAAASYKRYCKNVPTGGIESLNCLKEQ